MVTYDEIIDICNLRQLTPKSLESIKKKFLMEKPFVYSSKDNRYAITVVYVDETLNGNKIGEPFAVLVSFNSLSHKGYYLMNYDHSTLHTFYDILRKDKYGRQLFVEQKLYWREIPEKILMINLGYV